MKQMIRYQVNLDGFKCIVAAYSPDEAIQIASLNGKRKYKVATVLLIKQYT